MQPPQNKFSRQNLCYNFVHILYNFVLHITNLVPLPFFQGAYPRPAVDIRVKSGLNRLYISANIIDMFHVFPAYIRNFCASTLTPTPSFNDVIFGENVRKNESIGPLLRQVVCKPSFWTFQGQLRPR